MNFRVIEGVGRIGALKVDEISWMWKTIDFKGKSSVRLGVRNTKDCFIWSKIAKWLLKKFRQFLHSSCMKNFQHL